MPQVRVLTDEEALAARQKARDEFADLARVREWDIPDSVLDEWYPGTSPNTLSK